MSRAAATPQTRDRRAARSLAALLIAAATAAGAAESAAPRPAREAGPPHCRFTLPEELPDGGRPRWSGPCAGGRAEGLGVLRLQAADGAVHLYLGRLAGGQAVLGVIERPNEGWVAGRFDQGRRVEPVERNTLIEAFAEAAAAARAEAEGHRLAGRKASARHYRHKAWVLDAQLD